LTGSVLGLGQQQLGNIADTVSKPLDFSGAPSAPALNFGALPQANAPNYQGLGALPQLNYGGASAAPDAASFAGPNSATTDALYKAYTSRLQPRFDQEREAVESRLRDQGVSVATNPAAYENALRIYNQDRNDAYQQAMGASVSGGISENQNAYNRAMASRQQGITEAGNLYGAALGNRQQLVGELGQQFGQQMQQRQQGAAEQTQLFNAGTGARQQALNEISALRNQPINELAALLGTSGGVNAPQFANVPQVGLNAPDVMGANGMAYNAQQNAYNQQMNRSNAGLGALAGLAGTGLSTAFPARKVAGV
jgi:hypothetical protein